MQLLIRGGVTIFLGIFIIEMLFFILLGIMVTGGLIQLRKAIHRRG